MPRILAATDFSLRSQRSVRRAGLVARQCSADLVLVHVVDDDQPAELIELERREAEKFLTEQIASLSELQNLHCRAEIATGEAFDAVLRTAEDHAAELIVMGTHRKQLLRDIFIGTTIERVVRTGPYPVLMVNREVVSPYRRILAAVDMSDPSVHALEVASTLGLTDSREVVVVHAFVAPAKGKLFIADAPRVRLEEHVAGERRKTKLQLAAFLAAHGIRSATWSLRLAEGDAFDVITRAVEAEAPDLLVIGTHGRSGIAKLLLGSVAEKVLRRLDVGILAAPLRQRQ